MPLLSPFGNNTSTATRANYGKVDQRAPFLIDKFLYNDLAYSIETGLNNVVVDGKLQAIRVSIPRIKWDIDFGQVPLGLKTFIENSIVTAGSVILRSVVHPSMELIRVDGKNFFRYKSEVMYYGTDQYDESRGLALDLNVESGFKMQAGVVSIDDDDDAPFKDYSFVSIVASTPQQHCVVLSEGEAVPDGSFEIAIKIKHNETGALVCRTFMLFDSELVYKVENLEVDHLLYSLSSQLDVVHVANNVFRIRGTFYEYFTPTPNSALGDDGKPLSILPIGVSDASYAFNC